MAEKDYINKKSLYEDFMMLAKTQNGERQQGILGCAATVLMQTPADVVAVVRCKDCRYCSSYYDSDRYCDMFDFEPPSDDFYCRDGERKDDE